MKRINKLSSRIFYSIAISNYNFFFEGLRTIGGIFFWFLGKIFGMVVPKPLYKVLFFVFPSRRMTTYFAPPLFKLYNCFHVFQLQSKELGPESTKIGLQSKILFFTAKNNFRIYIFKNYFSFFNTFNKSPVIDVQSRHVHRTLSYETQRHDCKFQT